MHNKEFNYLAFVEWGESEKQRVVTVVAADPQANAEKIQNFLRAARP